MDIPQNWHQLTTIKKNSHVFFPLTVDVWAKMLQIGFNLGVPFPLQMSCFCHSFNLGVVKGCFNTPLEHTYINCKLTFTNSPGSRVSFHSCDMPRKKRIACLSEQNQYGNDLTPLKPTRMFNLLNQASTSLTQCGFFRASKKLWLVFSLWTSYVVLNSTPKNASGRGNLVRKSTFFAKCLWVQGDTVDGRNPAFWDI